MARRPLGRLVMAALMVVPLLALIDPSVPAHSLPADPPGSAPSAAVTGTGPSLELTAITPAVLRPGQALTITGTIRNTTAATLHKPTVRVVLRDENLDRAEILEWAKATGPALGSEVGRASLAATLAPGAAASFAVTVKGLDQHGPMRYGALPISVESGTTSVRTFAGYQWIKQYQPMSVAWAVPLTLDPDPDLFGPAGADREAAWAQALGPSSRLGRVLDATTDAQVTWAVDPTLTPSLLPQAVDPAVGATQESALREAVEARIRDGVTRHTPWVLPDADADVGAASGASAGRSLLTTLVERSAGVAHALGGRADVAWPADTGFTTTTEAAVRGLYGTPALAAEVISIAGRATGPGGGSPNAAQRSTSGLALLAYDDALSALFAKTTTPDQGALSTQQFVAESAALLNDLPGTQGRSLFVVAPRTFDPDPATAHAFLAAAASIPWLTTTSTSAELAAARTALRSTAAPVTRPADPATASPPPVLTPSKLAVLEQTLRTVRGVAQVRDDGAAFARTWARAAEQLASTRWRTAPVAWNTLDGRILAATRQTTTAVKVAAGTINFLADTGRLQITVTNGLDVPVKNIKVTVEAANPRLRIDRQPPVLRIGAQSRATVNIGVTALAAGVVPLRTTLTTPDGTVIGQGADVQVHVTPTGGWVYWSLGGLALVILLLGIVRSFSRRPVSDDHHLPGRAHP
ncbi:DUF6049 family protein [Oryzihumus sp.]